jgi:gluconokinase
MPAAARVVIGADIGTTSAKAVAFAPDGGAWGGGERAYELAASAPGRAEQDPELVVRAALEVIREAAATARARGAQVAGLSFSGAMHGLLALDAADRPLTPLVTWADGRAVAEAERLRDLPAAWRCTGARGRPCTRCRRCPSSSGSPSASPSCSPGWRAGWASRRSCSRA